VTARLLPAVWAASVCLFGLTEPAAALSFARDLSLFDQQVFGTREGLPQANVTALAQTPDGYLWVGTDGGLARFDGQNFTVFRAENTPALRMHRIRALLVDGEGSLWISTWGGAGLIRHRAGRFETFENQLGIGGSSHAAFAERAGHLWFGHPGGARRFVNGRFESLTTHHGVSIEDARAFGEDGADGFWVATIDGLLRFSGGRSERWTEVDGKPLVPTRSILPDGDGGVWIAAGTNLFRYHQGQLHHQAASNAALGNIQALLRDEHGTLWAATDGGLARWHNRQWRREVGGPGGVGAASALLLDREGTLWVGTQTGGLVRLSHGTFQSIANPELTSARVTSVAGGSAGVIWIGTDGGRVLRRDPKGSVAVHLEQGQCTNRVWALAEEAGRLWVGGERGRGNSLCRIDLRTRAVDVFGTEQGLPDVAVRAIVHDAGATWIGSHGGLLRIENERAVALDAPELANLDVWAIHRDRSGNLWIAGGGPNGGLHKLVGTTWHSVHEGLSNRAVLSIDEDHEGALWLGTMKGLSRYREGRITAWTSAQGLSDDPIFKAMPDREGNLWMCSPRGVIFAAKGAIAASEAGREPLRTTLLGSRDGLAADQCEGGFGHQSGWRGGDALWFPTGSTIAVVDPSRPRQTRSLSVPTIIEQARYDGRGVGLPDLGALPAGRGDLELRYTAPWLGQAPKLRFRYRLDPFDTSWVDAGPRRVAIYTQVPPGAYKFSVSYTADDGWTSPITPTTASIFIARPFFMTWWFRGLCVSLLAGLAASILTLAHRGRVRALEQQHQAILGERTRMARELHDTLAQGFTGISVQLEAAKAWMDEHPQRARGNLDQARALVRSSLSDARRAVWDLHPEAIAREGLVAALSAISRNLSGEVPIRVQVNGRPRRLPTAHEAAVARIGQEALTNALKHARANNIALTISFVDDGVHLNIKDNGRGFDPSRGSPEPGHLGLEGLRARAQAISGKLRITSDAANGTEISLFVPAQTSGDRGSVVATTPPKGEFT
jgi:signal transduction histidine kinase/ligand-binding sensor domain-containing protein